MAQAKRLNKVLKKQPINRRVMIGLLPCVAGSIYFFGWQCLFVVLWSAVVGFIVEFIFSRKRGEPVSEKAGIFFKNLRDTAFFVRITCFNMVLLLF